ncbi:type I restriction endonuclease subunit R [Caulobacter segnis]|uniref:type I restriction endonuclease subunit R n=1 Tax=Caulobacter segnis TaxID=88688 RepID=UPI001CBF78E3|nr:type I restriction endonuclease [Caulobacter segnis]UAL11681.1 DEAD/DEAH box helicase family protein [Caulobacter segnis]
MRSTDISEGGLETLIVSALTGTTASVKGAPADVAGERAPLAGPDDYIEGHRDDYDRAHALDLVQLFAFVRSTQPELVGPLSLETDSRQRRAFLARVRDEITNRGVIDVLRSGIRHGPHAVALYFPLPSPGNPQAAIHFAQNRFSVTRQLGYSQDAARRALDLAVFINGLPVATFELKNTLTGQTVAHAEAQYKADRDPRELIFRPTRCAVHFAMDDREVRMCSALSGQKSWFLPFNKGHNDGAGNPPNPEGVSTDYLWREILAKRSLADIVENFAGIIEERDARGRITARKPIFPRYHQLKVVRALCADATANGAGRRYLIQHSAGSGKSNSIAWTVHKLVGLEVDGVPIFDTVIVVTDRQVLDKNLKDTIGGFAQTARLMGHAERSGDLRGFIESGKKIVVTTIQKFPVILDDIGSVHRGRRFAIVIDEAHSSQGGRAAGALNTALGGAVIDEETTAEDRILAVIEGRRMLDNASYLAFTATPKNKTLELFGERYEQDGEIKYRPFHLYSMKQAIDEGFILDVLAHYTPVSSWYRLATTAEDDPDVDVSRTLKTLRRYVEGHDHAIATKAGIIVDHFIDQVIARRKVGGEARAMVATDGIERAIDYWRAINAALAKRGSPYKAIVAFSGTVDDAGEQRTEASYNGFPSSELEDRFEADPYRFLVVADKYLTGFDQPKLFAMYVDKTLAGVKAVQALSRLNRARLGKSEPVVLDFRNDSAVIEAAFSDFYRATILSGETDPNKLHDLKRALDSAGVYALEDIESIVVLFLAAAPRDQLDPVLDACSVYYETLTEDEQIAFKGAAKAFVRTYAFLVAILPYAVPEWEKLSIFLSLLIPKLPSPSSDDAPIDVLETIDMDSYRVEISAGMNIALVDEDAEIKSVPVGTAGGQVEPTMDQLSAVVREFNERFGATDFRDQDRVKRFLFEELPEKIGANGRVRNALRNSDTQNARIEHDRAVDDELLGSLADHTDLYALYNTDRVFKAWLQERLFAASRGAASLRGDAT